MYFLETMKKSFTFEGRSSRTEYWQFMVIIFLIQVMATIIDLSLNESGEVLIFSSLTNLFFIIPSISLTTRRLHDIGKSGWFQLLYLIPLLGWIIMLFFVFKKGSEEDNIYGESLI